MKHALLGTLALLLAAGPVLAQEKYKLEIKAKKGDKYTHSTTDSNEGTVNIEFGGQSIPQPVLEKETKKYKDEVLEVEGVVPTMVRRSFVEWSQTKLPPGATEPLTEKKALEGKTITLKKSGDKTEYEGAEGLPASELAKNRLRVDAFLANLPKDPVAVGGEWKLDEKLLLQDFAEGAEEESPVEFKAAKGTGRLERVEDHKGQKCAVLALAIEVDGGIKEQKGVKLVMKMKANVWLALDSGRPLTLKGDGTGDLTGEMEQGTEKVKLDGKFKFKTEGEQTYE